MASTTVVDRARWLGYRWWRHGLGGTSRDDVLDPLLLLGFQGSRQSAGEQSLSQRTSRVGSTSLPEAVTPDGPLVSIWSIRGAPHAHRASQLDFVRDALAPLASDDGGRSYVEAVDEVAAALTGVVTGATPKGEASAAVSDTVSRSLLQWCTRCADDHVPDDIFRAAGRAAQVVMGQARPSATILYPPPRVPQEAIATPRLALLRAYFRVNGPTRTTLFRDWMDGGTNATTALWDQLDEDLVRVEVENKRYDLPESLIQTVQQAPKANGVVLIPPNDPYLRQVDRTLLVPDSTRRHAVYRSLSGPGALLVDGEVAGTWRYRRAGHEVSIEPFWTLRAAQRTAAEQSACTVATSTGDHAPSVSWS